MKIFYLRYLLIGMLISSCASYHQNIMFKDDDGKAISQQLAAAEMNYVIKKNDLLNLEVYTNLGEKIVDPNFESFNETTNRTQTTSAPVYLVDVSGVVKLPLVDEIKLEGLTIKQAEQLLQKEYSRFYQQPFVILKFANKRVVVLGTSGGQVIPLTNENTRLTEVLALSKAVTNDAKVGNIRVLRGEETFVADLSNLKGYLTNDIVIMPGDIVYVEPVRRAFSEGLREYGPVISIITSVGTLIIVILQFNK